MSDDANDSNLAQSIIDKLANCKDFSEFGEQILGLVVARNKAIERNDSRQAHVYSYFLDGALAALTSFQRPKEELEQTVGIVTIVASGLLGDSGITVRFPANMGALERTEH